MRLFIALDLPEYVRAELATVQSRLRRSGYPVRWSPIEKLHLTLQFLGETDPALVPALLTMLADLAHSSLHLQLEGLGAFPRVERPSVIWVGLGGDCAALAQLQREVVAGTAPLGFSADSRPFHPHLTLGRLRPDANRAQIRLVADALSRAAAPQPIAWNTGLPRLYRSTLTRTGAIYECLGP
jgi:2'-5' RNA ligase